MDKLIDFRKGWTVFPCMYCCLEHGITGLNQSLALSQIKQLVQLHLVDAFAEFLLVTIRNI